MNMIFYSDFLSVTTPLSLKVVKIFFYFSSAIWILIYVFDLFFKIVAFILIFNPSVDKADEWDYFSRGFVYSLIED